MNRYGIVVTFDEAYEFIKLYDILRDMDFELTAIFIGHDDNIAKSDFIGRIVLHESYRG